MRQKEWDVDVLGAASAFAQERTAWLAERDAWRIRHADLHAQHQALAAQWQALRAARPRLAVQNYQQQYADLAAQQRQFLTDLRELRQVATCMKADVSMRQQVQAAGDTAEQDGV